MRNLRRNRNKRRLNRIRKACVWSQKGRKNRAVPVHFRTGRFGFVQGGLAWKSSQMPSGLISKELSRMNFGWRAARVALNRVSIKRTVHAENCLRSPFCNSATGQITGICCDGRADAGVWHRRHYCDLFNCGGGAAAAASLPGFRSADGARGQIGGRELRCGRRDRAGHQGLHPGDAWVQRARRIPEFAI